MGGNLGRARESHLWVRGSDRKRVNVRISEIAGGRWLSKDCHERIRFHSNRTHSRNKKLNDV